VQVASGRAAGLTPALIDAQAQLLELLELERTLGTCMHELRDHLQQQEQQGGAGEGAAPEQAAAPSAQGQDGEPEPAHAGGSDADSGTGASAPAAGSDAGSSGGASAAAGAGRRELRRRLLPQQLRTFQRMLGRQLAGSRVAFAIHNGRYEGRIDAGGSAFERLALPAALKAAVLAPAQAASAAVAGVGRVASALGSLLFGGPSPRQAEVSGVAAYDFLRAAELLGRQEAGGDALPEAAERLAQAQAPSTQQQPEQQPEQQQSQQQLRSRARQLLQQQQQAPRQQATTDARQEQAPSQPQQADQQPAPDARQEQPSHHHQQQQHLRLLGELEDQQPSPQADHPDHQQQQQPPLPEPEMNWLRAGVLGSDAVVTVSPSYAAELLDADPAASSAAVAEALAGREVVGMLNGLDERRWDPAGDPLLPRRVRFDAAGVAAGKAAAKQLLQQRLGLAVDPEVPVVAFLGRLEAQKGADIILGALPQLMGRPAALPGCSRMAGGDGGAGDSDGSGAPAAADASSDASGPPPPPSGRSMQLVMLGCGQQWVEEVIGQLPAMYPGRAAGIAAFNEPLAHLLLAGADYLLVPSRYEPCGLVALAALRYGALPIAAATGGLRDIVGEHNGYLLPNLGAEGCAADFRAAVAALAGGVARALAQHDSAAMHARRSAAMGEDVSWRRAVVQWEALLQRLADPAQPGEAGDGDDAEGASGGDGADRDGVSFGPAASSGGGRGRSSARGGKGAAAAAAALAVAPVEEQPLLRPAAATKSSR
jgi:glycosyltransferase involved in cell wall biosynthesis